MCTSGCTHDHDPSAFEQYTQGIAAAVAQTKAAANQSIDASNAAFGIAELDLDMGGEKAALAFDEIINTQMFAHAMLLGALNMRAGSEPGGCSQTTVHDLMKVTFCEGVAMTVEQLLEAAAV